MGTVDATTMPAEVPEIATAQLPEKVCPSGMAGRAIVRSGLDARCHVNMTSNPDMSGGSADFSASLSSSPIPSGVEGVLLTGNGLMMHCDAVDAEAYNHLFRTVLTLHKSCCWLLGDVLLLGDRQWGNRYTESKYEEAMQETGMSRGSLRNIVLTCRRFPVELRHADLSFTHHQEVAMTDADPDQREAVLKQAASDKISCMALRRQLKKMNFAAAKRPADALPLHEHEAYPENGENTDRPFGLLDLPAIPKPGAPPRWDALNFKNWVRKQNPGTYTLEQCVQATQLTEDIAAFHAAVLKRRAELEAGHASSLTSLPSHGNSIVTQP